MNLLPARGLYAITSATICVTPALLLRAVSAALRGGAVLIQYRDKRADAADHRSKALRLQALCREARVPLVINDGPVSLVEAQALDGLHLGATDGAVEAVRGRLPQAVIGATCGQSLARARQAAASGASYLAFGAFYPSSTKPQAQLASLALLQQARQEFSLPICAIGGITPVNAAALIAAGADYIAAVEGVFGAADIEVAARDYAKLFIAPKTTTD